MADLPYLGPDMRSSALRARAGERRAALGAEASTMAGGRCLKWEPSAGGMGEGRDGAWRVELESVRRQHLVCSLLAMERA
jgi:hypothetical protein